MNKQSHILRFRKKRQEKDRSNPLGMIGFLLAALVSIVVSIGLIFGVVRYGEITKDLASPVVLESLLDPVSGSLLEPTQLLDRSGTRVLWRFENPAVDKRRFLAITDGDSLFFSEAPESLILATLAAIDPVYFQRPDAFLAGLFDGNPDPIPELLVTELLLWHEGDHPYSEIRVRLLADQIVAEYGRAKVLEWYLNSAYFGNQIYGAAQAAEFYFGKEAVDLSLGESALLAAVASFPALNPLDAPTAARENQRDILEDMVEAGFISSSEANQAASAKLIYADSKSDQDPDPPPYVTYLLAQAGDSIPEDRLLRGGFKIVSTLDGELQHELTCILEIMSQRVYGQDPQRNPACEAVRLLPRYSGPFLEAGQGLDMDLVVYDPSTGQLLAMAGFRGQGEQASLEKPRDPGSLITPYLYLNAFRQGFGPASLVWDIPLPESDLTAGELHPGSAGEAAYLGPVSMRTAFLNDLLSPARQLQDSQGSPLLRSTLGLFGFSLPAANLEPPAVLEYPALEMLDLVQGFGVFVNRGYLTGKLNGLSGQEVEPVGILRLDDVTGREYSAIDLKVEKKVVSEELVYLVNHVLSDHDAWLDPRTADVFRIGRPAGVKTGYVSGNQSGWVIGYTPQIVVGTWTGGLDSGQSGEGIDPVMISASMWRAITQYVSQDMILTGWEMPPGINTEDVCYPSGALPTDYCPRVVREVFIQGNEPLGLDELYQSLEVNRETGLLASVFTPAAQIEERVYLNVPPRAKSWAAEAGVETPPVVYDLGMGDRDQGALQLTAPDNLSFVQGKVRIYGSIPDEGFDSARLQFGEGINPHSWLQIGADINSPGEDRYLSTWDTSELEEGIYALQLVVILENQQIQKRSLIVSVDNTAPEMILITDLSGGEIAYQKGKDLLFEVRFTNPAELKTVEFILDGETLSSRRVGPFVHPWRMTLGEHELVVIAEDQAGNLAELEVNFSVIRE